MNRPLFTYEKQVFLRETDATGVIYFSEELNYALETFEAYLASNGFTLKEMIEKGNFFMPIVHVEADFKKPLKIGDLIEISLFLEDRKDHSFTLKTEMIDRQKNLVGMAKIVHVTISKESGTKIPIPESILDCLS